ncbi:MAG TPA: hypothetical protein VFR75_04335 [Solirubrobacterales bacterium]|nr:hypothetical protein [Solirubrobacterales bacterium]
MTPDSAQRYWLAGYALATQSSFPRERLTDDRYRGLLEALDGNPWEQVATGPETFTIDVRSAITDQRRVFERLEAALAPKPEGVDICLIDLRPFVVAGTIGPVYPRAFTTIADGLAQLISESELGDSHPLVIVAELGDEQDIQFRRFHDLSKSGQLSIVDQKGSLWSSRFPAPDVRLAAAQFERSLEEVEMDLKAKMIRRYGVFPRLNRHGEIDGHTRHFFDGTYCHKELRVLFRHCIEEALEGDGPAVVVQGGSPGHWLGAPLSQAVSDFCADTGADVRLLPSEDLEQDDSGARMRKAVAVVPVLDRGQSLAGLAEAVKAWAPAATLSGLAVIGTGVKDKLKLEDGSSIGIRSLMQTHQQTVIVDMLAPDASYYTAGVDGTERFLPFTSGEFWELASEAGFIPERDPPQDRRQLRRVPDLLAFTNNNAAWVANKIEIAIKLFTEREATDVSIAMVADETAASCLSDVLAATVGNTPLGIPRQALIEWRETRRRRELLTHWREEAPLWLIELDHAASRKVVVLDEFSFSGNTLSDLTSLLTRVNFEVLLVLAIASFSREGLSNALSDYPHFAFYETEWRGREVAGRMEQA